MDLGLTLSFSESLLPFSGSLVVVSVLHVRFSLSLFRSRGCSDDSRRHFFRSRSGFGVLAVTCFALGVTLVSLAVTCFVLGVALAVLGVTRSLLGVTLAVLGVTFSLSRSLFVDSLLLFR